MVEELTELYVCETWRGRWVVARKPFVESGNDPSVVADFADEATAQRWMGEYQQRRRKLYETIK